MTHPHQNYLNNVFPNVPEATRVATLDAYPDVRLDATAGFTPLADCNIVMLIGLTGTGKSTALRALRQVGTLAYRTDIPTRRQLADLVLIPYAQHYAGEAIAPVKDRTQRFAYTRAFREHAADGGTAAAFTWLHFADATGRVLSEGVRGPNEIAYALANTRWRLVELWVDPVTRLRRLSHRADAFDAITAATTADLSFLPDSRVEEVRAALAAGDITPEAVTTVRAESHNYGAQPYDPANTTPRYCCIRIDTLTPAQVATAVVDAVHTLDAEAT
jgi:energy-coupling factor transporter ATP-binding protein EcfA2